jgi:hypothetical protein
VNGLCDAGLPSIVVDHGQGQVVGIRPDVAVNHLRSGGADSIAEVPREADDAAGLCAGAGPVKAEQPVGRTR